MSNSSKTYAIGIDLGTTYSCMGVYRQGKVEIIPIEGERTTPSYIAFTDDEVLLGETARYQANQNPENTIYDAKRLIGRRYTNAFIQQDIKLWPFKVVPDEEERACVEVTAADGKTKRFAPEEISALLLKHLKSGAKEYLQADVSQAIITVPAYFTDAQRQATIDAGKLAGLEVLHIINEPTAAAIAYGHTKKQNVGKLVLVFDFGGGTLDVTILKIENSFYKVRSTTGHMHLGGEDFDNRILDFFVQQFKRRYQADLTDNKKEIRRLKTKCEKAKKELTFQLKAHVELTYPGRDTPFYSELTRARFEQLCADQFAQAMHVVEKALTDAKVKKDEIDEIVLSGGSSRIPKIKCLLREFFNGKPLSEAIDPDEAVATGAAIQAAIFTGADDEEIRDVIVQDVTPMALGIKVTGGIMSEIIERATPIPVERKRMYTTSEDNQEAVSVHVYEGDSKITTENSFLAGFELKGIRKAKAGVPRLIITFKKDINGVLQVTAEDETAKIRNAIIINRNNTPVAN